MAEQGAEKLKYVPQRLNPSLKATPLTQRWKRRSTPNQSFSAGAEAVPYPKPIYETSDSLCILQSSVVVQYEHCLLYTSITLLSARYVPTGTLHQSCSLLHESRVK